VQEFAQRFWMVDLDPNSKPSQAGDRYQIFEQAALERLRTGSDQTKAVAFLPLPVRFAAVSAISITGLGLLWSVLGRVPVQVNGLATIVPQTGVSSAQARLSGVLYYQVSGVGHERLSPIYQQRNLSLSEFWRNAVVNSGPTLTISRLKHLVEGVALPAQGQPLVMPGTREEIENLKHSPQHKLADVNLSLKQLYIKPNVLIALVDNPTEVETLDALRRLIAPKLAIQRQTSRDSRKRAQSYSSVDFLIRDQLRDKETELSQRRALLSRLKILWSKGYISEIQLLQEQSTVNNLSEAVVQLRRDRLGNNFSGTDQRQQAAQADLNALQATDQLQNGLVSFLSKSYNISPPSGLYLVAKYRQSGMSVASGDELFTFSITPPSLPSRIPVFVDGGTVQQLSEGNRVLVTPKGISRAQYGGIVGIVDEVARLPFPGDTLASVAGGRSLATAVSQIYPTPYLVRVKLQQTNRRHCEQLVSRLCYVWSTSRVPPFPVRMGSQADVQITTIYRRPIEFVMPALRQALGLVVENR
jgi:HlyD family secretion protein